MGAWDLLKMPEPDMNKKTPALWLLLLSVALIGIVSMPREEYSGDATVLRCETVALINYQDLDVPAKIARNLEAGSGNYFFENKFNHRLYCKYGVLNDLMYIPPLLVEKWRGGKLPFLSHNRAIYLNWFNILLAIASAWYLYLIALKYTTSPALAVAFVLTAFYCTFWWNYLRAQCYEIYQVLFMLGFYYHLTASFRISEPVPEGETQSAGRRDLLLAGTWFGALILVKTVFVVLIPVVFLVSFLPRLDRPVAYPALLRRAAWFGLPVLCALCALFAANNYQYGSPLETGWSQGDPMFGGKISVGLYGYLLGPGHSIFLYFPILTFALFGYREFFKCHRSDAVLFSSMGIVMLLLCSNLLDWGGGWGYGSRYLLPYLPLLSLPFVKTMECLSTNWRKPWAGGCAAIVALALILSFRFQLNVNAMPFFAYYKLENFCLGFHVPEIDRYFKQHTLGEVDADLIAYKNGKPWPVFEVLKPSLNAKGIEEIQALLRANSVSNYYFWPDRSQGS